MTTADRIVPKEELTEQLVALGVRRGSVLLVHSSFSKVAPVEDGPVGLIAALRTALGPDGTLVMPSMTDDDDHPFNVTRSACIGMGVVADTFWRLPGVLRSDNPHAFAAAGPHAARITAPHPLDVPHGAESPVGHVHALDGEILMLGVGHDANTTIHLAEMTAGVSYRLPHHVTVRVDGRATRYDYEEADHCCERFSLVDEWLDHRQRYGTVGHAQARLMRSRDVLETAVGRLREDMTVFLHPSGECGECDAARASL